VASKENISRWYTSGRLLISIYFLTLLPFETTRNSVRKLNSSTDGGTFRYVLFIPCIFNESEGKINYN
jgi:hypothetical protein